MAATQTMQFHCTTCPSECMLDVVVDMSAGTPKIESVHGNRCQRGAAFAEQEITCPMRILASTVPIIGGDQPLLPVRTKEAIPRSLHMQAMELLRATQASAPVSMGDVIIPNILDTGVDLVASLDIDRASR